MLPAWDPRERGRESEIGDITGNERPDLGKALEGQYGGIDLPNMGESLKSVN